MKSTKPITTSILVIFLITGFLFSVNLASAQDVKIRHEMKMSYLKDKLDLTDDQAKQIEGIFDNARKEAEKFREENRKKRDEMIKAREEKRKATDEKMKKVLTNDQKKKFDEIQANWRKSKMGKDDMRRKSRRDPYYKKDFKHRYDNPKCDGTGPKARQ